MIIPKIQNVSHLNFEKQFILDEALKSHIHKTMYSGKIQDNIKEFIFKMDPFHESDEAYKIEIEDKIKITATSEAGFFYALRTLLNLQELYDGIPYGSYMDYPDMKERRLHVDCGRKYFSKAWIIKIIERMSYLKMNTLQLHFSENKGYRIASRVAPEIVSKDHLSFRDLEAIFETAKRHHVKIIPSFDTPGHTEHILKTYPEFGQIDIHGQKSKVALDISNKEAVSFVYRLLDEIIEIFSDSKEIHLGADEYMEFDREPFVSDVQPYLNAFAKRTLGEEYNWKDVIATYINNLAAYVYDKGLKPRIWNDGIYYGETDLPTSGGAPQKVTMHSYIGIDFWAQMIWNPSIATLDTLLQKGFQDFYNVNADFFYYVLRPEMPTDGRKQHSFWFHQPDQRIYEMWTPGTFQKNMMDDEDKRIKGVAMAIWNDKPNLVSEAIIWDDIKNEMIAFAMRTWNVASNETIDFDAFKEMRDKILKKEPFKDS